MAGLTCQIQASDGGISEDNAVSSPFIYIPKTQKKLNTSSKEDYITSFLFEDERPFDASAGDETSYFPPFQVPDFERQTVTDLALPSRTYAATGSPVSAFSMSSADDEDVPEVQSLIRPSATTTATPAAASARKPSDAGSRASSFSIERRRTSRGQASSSSRSTSSTRPRRSMQHLRGRSGAGPGTYTNYTTPSRPDMGSSSQRNERDLVALHRESCLLFSQMGPYKELSSSPTEHNSLSAHHSRPHVSTAPTRYSASQQPQHSASASPLLRSENTPTSPFQSDGVPSPLTRQSTWNPIHEQTNNVSSPPPLPKTVIDWTSPSTRRREYEKIDRASRGIRGAWRKFAPQWCQSKDARAPFFEECKAGHAKDDGSVRRFRMDIPEEDDADKSADQPPRQGLGVLRNGLVSALTRFKLENETVQPVKEKSAPIPTKQWRPFVNRRNSSLGLDFSYHFHALCITTAH
ncbi:hypothetical protein H101_02049 [Trichophyton interdigitale H6]|nr:hypothetical protein H101_02049 [Trichophyton interdigitale H6]